MPSEKRELYRFSGIWNWHRQSNRFLPESERHGGDPDADVAHDEPLSLPTLAY
jgi:hypothetical protein